MDTIGFRSNSAHGSSSDMLGFMPGAFSFQVLFLSLFLGMFSLPGCTPAQQTNAVYAASNQVAQAISWLDARAAHDFESRSNEKIAQLKESGGSLDQYDQWVEGSRFEDTQARIQRAYDAHALIVAYLADPSLDKSGLVDAIFAIQEALDLTIAELESHAVDIPPDVKQAATFLPALAEVVK